MIIFDTDIFTHFAQAKPIIRSKLDNHPDEGMAITAITFYEIVKGRGDMIRTAVDREPFLKASRLFRISINALDAFEILDLDDKAIEHFERLRDGKKTKKMGRMDMLIASIALSNDALLATGNVKDYKDVNNLKFEDWSK
jgi:tRNA(fMet)-specific endonuclease VapC